MAVRVGGILLAAATCVLAGGSLFVTGDGGGAVPVRWDDRQLPVRFVMSSDGYPGSGIALATLEAELTAAVAQINAIAESRIQLAYDGIVERNDSGGQSALGAGIDGINLVTFSDPDLTFGPGVAAVCAQTVIAADLVVDDSNNDLNGDGVPDLANGTYPAGTVLDADIVFNGNTALDASGANGTADIRALALHELGHCMGLSHSAVRDAVMFPFQSNDVASARQLKEDDVAHLAAKYPQAPAYEQAYGYVEGRILSGISGQPIVGAHVYVASPDTREAIVGGFSGVDGSYRLPVPVGSYFVGIEPLDGEPAGLDPERMNILIAGTTDVFFPEEYYDAAESSIDAPDDAELVPVTAGVATAGVDLVTNTLDVLSSSVLLERGVNYVSYPVSVPLGISSFDLLAGLSLSSEVQSIQRLNVVTGRFDTAHLVDGVPRGDDFPISRGAGLIVHTTENEQLTFNGAPDCPAFNLEAGTNLIGAPCAPAGYSAFDLLRDLGTELDVISVQSWDPDSGSWVSAGYAGSEPTGIDFPVIDGGAYLVDMRTALAGFRINSSGADFPPTLLSVSPGEAVPGAIVTLKGTGFADDLAQNVVLFNETSAEILEGTTGQLVVRVPAAAESGTVQVLSRGLAGNALPFVVLLAATTETEGVVNAIASGQTVSGRLDSAADVDEYRFLAIENNRVTVHVRTLSAGVPELLVSLLGPRGGSLTAVSNGTGSSAVIRDFRAPETGFYTLQISSLAGSGPYTVELILEGVPGEPRLLAISGDYQTGVMGTELPVPLQIVAVDETGLPASGVPISFAVRPLGNPQAAMTSATTAGQDATRAMTAGDMTTLSSGLLTASVQLPDETTGDFEIVVTAPFRSSRPVTLLVTSIANPISSVVMTPASEYACSDGQGCPAGEVVDIPYELVFLDATENGIENVLVEFAVVAGGGKVLKTQGGDDENVARDRSDADGRVHVYHRVGEQVHFSELLIGANPLGNNFDPLLKRVRKPQQVAATVPGQPLPAVFSVRARAGEPFIVRSLRSQNQRVSVGSARFGAVTFFVSDRFGNPVEGAPVTGGPAIPGLVPAAGFFNGELFTGSETNADGIWSGGLGALTDGSLESPTINEFGEVLLPPFVVTYSVGSLTIPYNIDVDMGPYVFVEGAGASALIGQPLSAPVSLVARRMQRVDQDLVDDNGQWDNEDFSQLIDWPLSDLPVTTSIRRLDGFTNAMLQANIPTTRIGGEQIVQNVTDTEGRVTFDNVTVGGVFGGINLLNDIGTQTITFYRGENAPVLEYREETFTFEQSVLPIRANPVILTIDFEDPEPADPAGPRTYPGIALASGINAAELDVRLNDQQLTFGTQRTFPFFSSLTLDGQSVSFVGGSVPDELRPQSIRMIYYPTSDMLIEGASNNLVIRQFSDDLRHPGVARDPAEDTDNSDNTITFEFLYP